MTDNTISINQQMTQFDHLHSVWLFAYGSLIFRPDFPYLEARPAQVRNWARRFWQGSHDHRGTRENPGRVVTLIETPGAVCGGMAYLISPEVFAQLDYREKNGYLRLPSEMQFDDGSHATGVLYIAKPDNGAYLGPADDFSIAQQIAQAHGPSGPNRDYLLCLAEALRRMGQHDEHVFALEGIVRQLQAMRQ